MKLEQIKVGDLFYQKNIRPGLENCRAHIVGSSFEIYYFIKDPKKQDIRTFRDTLLRFHYYVQNHIPFITISYLGSTGSYDCSLNIVGEKKEVIDLFFVDGNAVILYLIDFKQ